MAEFIYCPDEWVGVDDKRFVWPQLFLGGGMPGGGWRSEMAGMLGPADRLAVFDPSGVDAPEKAVEWGFNRALKADAALFWFAPDCGDLTEALIGLGFLLGWDTKAFVGIHPGYGRRDAVLHALKIRNVPWCGTLQGLADDVIEWHGDFWHYRSKR